MATIVVGCMYIVVEGTSKMQAQPKGIYFLRPFVLAVNINVTMATILIGYEVVQTHTHYHCQVINKNRYLLTVAMAIIVVDYT